MSGKLYSAGTKNHKENKKSLQKLKKKIEGQKIDAVVFDGAAGANMLHPNPQMTFGNYASTKFKSYISKHLKVCDRVDVVCDIYTNPTA